MKRLSYILLLVFLGSCASGKIIETKTENIKPSPEGLKGSVVGSESVTEAEEVETSKEINVIALVPSFSNSAGIGKIMNFLASDELQGRDSGSEGIAKAASFIEAIFKSNNIKPYFKTYKDTLSNFEETAYNVVGYIEGTDPVLKNEYIIVGAHYDHIGVLSPINGDKIANGANDNASGTTTVLELARYFGNVKTNKRSIIFALFSAEEKGLLGSRHLAKKLKAENLNLYTMLNFEMVGVPLKGQDYFMYITGYEQSNLATVSNSYTDEKLVGFLPTAKSYGLFSRSDNYPFHQEFNVPSQTFCTFDFTNFDHYHKVGDENELMDFEHMATLVNKTIPVLDGIMNAATKEIKYN